MSATAKIQYVHFPKPYFTRNHLLCFTCLKKLLEKYGRDVKSVIPFDVYVDSSTSSAEKQKLSSSDYAAASQIMYYSETEICTSPKGVRIAVTQTGVFTNRPTG